MPDAVYTGLGVDASVRGEELRNAIFVPTCIQTAGIGLPRVGPTKIRRNRRLQLAVCSMIRRRRIKPGKATVFNTADHRCRLGRKTLDLVGQRVCGS